MYILHTQIQGHAFSEFHPKVRNINHSVNSLQMGIEQWENEIHSRLGR